MPSKYRLFCETEDALVECWGESTPTTCPNNTAHTIDPDKTVVVQQLNAQPVRLESPYTSDGKIIFLPCQFPGGVFVYLAGSGDDLVNGRGAGPLFNLSSDQSEDLKTLEFYFNDWVYMAGGGLSWEGAKPGDYISLEFYAPATPVTPNGTNEGNCNLVAVAPGGPEILIVPAAGDGAYDVDLDVANIVPSACEDECNTTPSGYWDWDAPIVGRGTITPSITPGHAWYHLFVVDIPLVRFANKVPPIGSGNMPMALGNIKAKKMLPHWIGKTTVYHAAAGSTLSVGWFLLTARAQTI